MKRYLPWMVAIGLLIAGATVWYFYGTELIAKQPPLGSGYKCPDQETCPNPPLENISISG